MERHQTRNSRNRLLESKNIRKDIKHDGLSLRESSGKIGSARIALGIVVCTLSALPWSVVHCRIEIFSQYTEGTKKGPAPVGIFVNCSHYRPLGKTERCLQGWLTWIQNSATNPTLALLSRWHELKRVERESVPVPSFYFTFYLGCTTHGTVTDWHGEVDMVSERSELSKSLSATEDLQHIVSYGRRPCERNCHVISYNIT
ncbi:hypothetical protein NQ317_003071 [Molorchus minor]|uniref:Uncharacterized protein n=1 Tax=Molorchus minor TaxID=1323400 RepID=A0ABQ9J557_9CUCU|nr:hypothetical protein NQ317_003071 [Molorchus minor]